MQKSKFWTLIQCYQFWRSVRSVSAHRMNDLLEPNGLLYRIIKTPATLSDRLVWVCRLFQLFWLWYAQLSNSKCVRCHWYVSDWCRTCFLFNPSTFTEVLEVLVHSCDLLSVLVLDVADVSRWRCTFSLHLFPSMCFPFDGNFEDEF